VQNVQTPYVLINEHVLIENRRRRRRRRRGRAGNKCAYVYTAEISIESQLIII
jgi:hypothetical protein